MDLDLKGIVLAGVHHWLDSQLEQAVARPLVPIANRPLIEHVLCWMKDGGTNSVSVCANSDTQILHRCLGDGSAYGLGIDYYEDHMPRGPAGCVRDAAARGDHGHYLIADATIIPYSVDLRQLLDAHRTAGAVMTVVAVRDQSNGRNMLSPVGIYLVNRAALGFVSDKGYQDIKETLIPRLYQNGQRVVTHVIDGTVPRVTGADSCMAANAWLLEKQLSRAHLPQGYRRVGESMVHETAQVSEAARLLGPVLVGPAARVDEGVTLVGPTVIGAACKIEPHAMISRSILWDYATVGRSCVLDRCILTYRATVEAHAAHGGTVCGAAPAKRTRFFRRWFFGGVDSAGPAPVSQ